MRGGEVPAAKKYNSMVLVVTQLQAQVFDLSQQVGLAKNRRHRDVVLERRLMKMKVHELREECLARGFNASGTAPELRIRIGLELAGRQCKCGIAESSGVVAAITAEADVLTTDAQDVLTTIGAELRAEYVAAVAAVHEDAAEEATATGANKPTGDNPVEKEEPAPVD